MRVWEIRNCILGLHDVMPDRPSAGETVIQVSHVGICGSDIPKLLNPAGFDIPDSWRPGHEIVGTDWSGRVVAVDPLVPCCRCEPCMRGDSHLCPGLRRLGWELPGGLAQQVVVPIAGVHPLPAGIDPLHATLADPAAVAVHGLRCSPVSPPGNLAVIGAGTVGLLTALFAHDEGWTVTVIHRESPRPSDGLAKSIPATFCTPRTLGEHCAFGVVVDAATGASSAPLDLALRVVDDGGTVMVQNAYHPEVRLRTPLREVFRRSVCLIGSFSHCRRPPGDFTLALDLIGRHSESAAHLASNVGMLDGLPNALSGYALRSGRSVLVVPAS
jgi:threonine dehydrogenase-like Zn-dependent dehydrogenase